MAKYCFYCGRELSPGERCHCIEPAAGSTYGSAGSSNQAGCQSAAYSGQTAYAETAGAKTYTSSQPHHAQKSRNGKNNRAAEDFFGKAGNFRNRRFSRVRTLKDQLRTLFPTFIAGFKSNVQYFTKPATKINLESMRVKRPLTFVTILVVSLLAGNLGLMMSLTGAPFMDSIIGLLFGSESTYVFRNHVGAAAILSVLAFLFIMSICLSFYIASRFSNRRPAFRKVMDLVSISLVYLFVIEVFLLITLFMGSRGSISLVLISFLLMGITHLLSFRNSLGLSEDIVFFFLIFVYIFSYILIRILIYLSAKVLILL